MNAKTAVRSLSNDGTCVVGTSLCHGLYAPSRLFTITSKMIELCVDVAGLHQATVHQLLHLMMPS